MYVFTILINGGHWLSKCLSSDSVVAMSNVASKYIQMRHTGQMIFMFGLVVSDRVTIICSWEIDGISDDIVVEKQEQWKAKRLTSMSSLFI